MNCCICGKKIENVCDNNNPFPLINPNDMNERCCADCNEHHVIPARILQLQSNSTSLKDANIGDRLVIFCCDDYTYPRIIRKETNSFLVGIIENIFEEKGTLYANGSWGNWKVCENDNFAIF